MILKHWSEAVIILLIVVTLIQLAYYLIIFSKLAFYKPKQKLYSQEQPVSVIVCAKNEAGNLLKNLPGVLVQTYKTTHQVILVDDNSTDDSKYVIEELQRAFKNLNPLKLKQEARLTTGKKFPLSMGIKAARYETLLLTDADCVPASEKWIKLMQDGFNDGTEIVLGYGAYRKTAGMLNKIIRFETFHSALQYLSYALAGIPYMGVGRNLSYKKEVFLRNHGFLSDSQLPGGDDDLFINKAATKTNTNIVIDPNAHTLSEPKKTWENWLNQKYRHYSTSKYYKKNHQLLLGLYSATQFLIYPLTIAALFYNWKLALLFFCIRLIVQAIIFNKAMKKLNEADLFPMFVLFDMWMCVYYLMFLPALFKQPEKKWN
ncbi:MAG: glycosyltransferase [Segetibacter sp.]|nr:glycosyltransferase [Segetibacter sp.]